MFGWFCIQVQARSKSYVLANLLITLNSNKSHKSSFSWAPEHDSHYCNTWEKTYTDHWFIVFYSEHSKYQHTSFTQSHTYSCKLEFFVCLLFYTSAPCLTFRHTLILWWMHWLQGLGTSKSLSWPWIPLYPPFSRVNCKPLVETGHAAGQ